MLRIKMNTLSELLAEFLDLINVKSIEAIGIKVFAAIAVFLVAFWVWRMLKRFIDRRLRQDSHNDEATIRTYKNIVRFIVMVPGILLAVHVLGINLGSLFTTSGLFAVALAFAMKTVSENYISGAMLRFERVIKPGDVLETEGAMVRVKSIGFRATIARTKDEKDLVIPNSQLVQNRVANYTYRDSVCRVWTFVGVSYSSDLNTVREVLEGVCASMAGMSGQHAPEVLLTEFADSAVNYKVSVWIEDPWKRGLIKSQLNEAIWRSLKEAGIVIACPQINVHFDETFTISAGLGPAHMQHEENE
jgi:small-conductance mechanosensitive channel